MQALEEGDSLMNDGKLKEALPYYETIMEKVNFQVGLLYLEFNEQLRRIDLAECNIELTQISIHALHNVP